MKNIIATFLVCLTLGVTGCSKISDMERVKNGTLDFNKSITVGQAFDNWHECQERYWKEAVSDNGQRLVEFSCVIANASSFYAAAKSKLPYESDYAHFDVDRVVAVVSWVVNVDDSFEVNNIATTWQWKNGRRTQVSVEVIDMLNSVYNNQVSYDVSQLQGDSLAASQAARAYADSVQILYAMSQ